MKEETFKKIQRYSLFSMIISAMIFAMGNIIAIFLYPNYSFSGNFFSDLGVRHDTVITIDNEVTDVSAAPFPEIFNVTLYLCGLFMMPFLPAAYTIVKENKISNFFFRLSAITGLTLGPLLIGVGIFDVAKNIDTHVDFATNLMLMIGVTSLFWALGVIFLNKDAPYKQFKSWMLDPAFVLFIIFVSWVLVWGKPNLLILRDLSYQVYQKFVALTFIPYFSVVSWRLLKILENQ